MHSTLYKIGTIAAVALLISGVAAAQNTITIQYNGVEVGSVVEGSTYEVPAFSSLNSTQQNLLTLFGLVAEYQKMEGLKLTLPDGCLDEDIVVNVSPVEANGALVAIEFEVQNHPDGYTFASPLEITFPYGAYMSLIEDENSLIIAYYVGSGFTTEDITNLVIDKINQTVTAQIPHMSVIALRDDSKALPAATVAGIAVGIAVGIAALGLAGLATLRAYTRSQH